MSKPQPRRNFLVFITLVSALSLTSVFLLAISPAPLLPDAATSLFAIETPQNLDAIFQTQQPVQAGRWAGIFIHHSRTAAGSALSLGQAAGGLGDHFVIGNGDGCADGEIQIGQRWNRQLSANPAATRLEGPIISICLVGDFDRMRPSELQLRRLGQLLGALQTRFGIPAAAVVALPDTGTPAGVGRYFPLNDLRKMILP